MAMSEEPMQMPGLLGSYVMTRDSSGTSWQPDSSAMDGTHRMSGPWMTMWHGNLTTVYTHQGGPRGDSESFSESMLMFMARRSIGADALGLRAMISADPTMGARGYPLLFQTGETANGHDPLVDRQHPHNLLMELTASYSKALSDAGSLFVYGGPVGEPALGPSAFMHRFASEVNPEAPLTHHWMDATHIAFGVITVGGIWHNVKVDASAFNGREPNEHRYGVQFRSLDSSSVRITYNPTSHWSLQASSGYLASPEELEPDISVRRTTASIVHDQPFAGGHWQTIFSWGSNEPGGGHKSTDGFLLDSALQLQRRHTLFGRVEHVDKDELFAHEQPLSGAAFAINKLSLGYQFDFAQLGPLRLAVGAMASRHWIPDALVASYGPGPSSYTLFIRATVSP
jgi:hypothetical protein